MVSLNYGYLEKLIAESKMDQKELAMEIGLPEKFFSKLETDGSNLNVGNLCMMVDYFGVNVEELITNGTSSNFKDKISQGKKIFAKYYEYQRKVICTPEPDIEAYKSSWVSDISTRSVYTKSPEQFYVEQKSEYKHTVGIFDTMENVLISIVSSYNCDVSKKDILKSYIIEYLVYGIRPYNTIISSRQLTSLANKACINLVDELEYKKII